MTEPEILAEYDSYRRAWGVSDRDPLLLIVPAGRPSTAIEAVDFTTGGSKVLAPNVDDMLVGPIHLPLPSPVPGNLRIEYVILDGVDAGLWVVGSPL